MSIYCMYIHSLYIHSYGKKKKIVGGGRVSLKGKGFFTSIYVGCMYLTS